ncbi:MAG TPA: hypothetical protein VJU15_05115 [Gemmatimonadales bacterium]|nr:hypothetical protein [Gemmatimonadales bacterium]
MRGARGHSLVEVMVAGVVIVAGIIPVGFAIATGIRLATRGRLRAEAAMAVMSRIEILRATCPMLLDGSAVVNGRDERWTVTGGPEVRDVTIRVTIPHPVAPVTDSVVVSLRCP